MHYYSVVELWLDAEFSDIDRLSLPDPGVWLVTPQISTDPSASKPTDCYFRGLRHFSEDPPVIGVSYSDTGMSRLSKYCVNTLAVVTSLELDLDGNYYEDDCAEDEGAEEVYRVLKDSHSRIDPVMRYFVDWIRSVGNQPRVGRFDSGDVGLTQSAIYVDGEKLPYGSSVYLPRVRTRGEFVFQQQKPSLSLEQATNYLARAILNESPRLSATLYADAKHDYDLRRQVLFAAVALEIEIKTLLRESANEYQKDLIDLLLNSPRDYSAAAAQLFHKPCRVVTGRSLNDENRTLFNAVNQLFANRNRIAHKGFEGLEPPEKLQELIAAAGRALAWCEAVRNNS